MTELKSIQALVELLTAAERRRVVLLVLLLVLTGGLEILGLGTIFIFISMLNGLSSGTQITFRIGSFDTQMEGWPVGRFAAVGGFFLIGIFAIKAGLVLGVQVLMMRFIFGIYRRFSAKLFTGYLKAPLAFHIERGIAEIQSDLNVQPAAIFNSAAVSLAYIGSNALAIAGLFAVLCFIDPLAALLALTLLGAVGGVYYTLVRRKLLALGRQRHLHIAAAIKWVGHAITGIREVRLIGAESFFRRGFQQQVHAVTAADRSIRIASYVPGIVNESALVVGVVGVMLFYFYSGRSLPELLPTLATFGLAGVRMMGMAASMVAHIQTLQFHGPAIRAMRDLEDELQAQALADPSPGAADLVFKRSVVLRNINFQYPHASMPTLRDVTLEIPKGTRTALLGASGSGKTTVLSILLGLLEPSSGAVLVDGVPIRSNLRSWFARLAYVPQSIFILDDTVRANVLFDRERAPEGDETEIWAVLEVAQIGGLVRSLPLGLETVLGDNGAKLSGGERQRIGIARALLRQPELLVLDEATSALDRETERKVLEGISEHYRGMTLVIATHRTETVQSYARRYSLQDGALLDLYGSEGASDILESAAG